ncbi:MAG: phage gp6-like head-tail connector protein [Clostridiales bacterium]|nr:MAG: phage gp6-like head-tail connector protein [Clostridiales bacterium]
MYITISRAKKHLQIDECFKEDDEYILDLIKVAEDAVARNLNVPLAHLVKNGYLPQSVEHSILLLIGNLYANREPVSFTTASKVPYTLDYLLGLYKHYFIF